MGHLSVFKSALLAVVLGFFADSSMAELKLTEQQYHKLLPTTVDGQINYTIRLADKLTIDIHCELLDTPDGGFDIDRNNCHDTDVLIDWKSNYPETVNLSLLGSPSEATMEEHKLWAIAFAHASGTSRVAMQFGLRKGVKGTFDLDKAFGTGEMFGDYFERQMNPNYFVSKGLQESNLGKDLPFTERMTENEEDDGVLQIEYPGSAWSELQGVAGGGFPLHFQNLNPKALLSSNNGPARNIFGSAISSGLYNASALGIASGSLPWDRQAGNEHLSINSMPLFLQTSPDPDALSMIMAFMYNRGPYAAKDQPLKNDAVMKHCMNIAEDLEDDWTCFTKQKDFGAKYIRQIPDVTNTLNNYAKDPAHVYETRLTADDIQNYLDLLGRYGLYQPQDIANAQQAAAAVFEVLAVNGTISYQQDFGRVLEKILLQLPVYGLHEGGQHDDSTRREAYLHNATEATFFIVTENRLNQVNYSNYVYENTDTPIDLDGRFKSLVTVHSREDADCTAEANDILAQARDRLSGGEHESIQITLTLDPNNAACLFQLSEYIPEKVPEGYWDRNKLYSTEGQVVTDAINCRQYTNAYRIQGGKSPSIAYQQDVHGPWRLVDDTPVEACEPLVQSLSSD